MKKLILLLTFISLNAFAQCPNTSGTNSMIIDPYQKNCSGYNIDKVIVDSSSLINGVYNFAYTLSGANTGTFTASSVPVGGGKAYITIPSAQVSNVGSTIITITGVTNPVSNCSTPFSPALSSSYFRSSIPTVSGTTAISTNGTLNSLTAGIVTLTGTGLSDGKYDIMYSMSAPGSPTNYYAASAFNVFTGGNGSFTLIRSPFTITGLYTIRILGIAPSQSSCYDMSTSFLSTTINVN